MGDFLRNQACPWNVTHILFISFCTDLPVDITSTLQTRENFLATRQESVSLKNKMLEVRKTVMCLRCFSLTHTCLSTHSVPGIMKIKISKLVFMKNLHDTFLVKILPHTITCKTVCIIVCFHLRNENRCICMLWSGSYLFFVFLWICNEKDFDELCTILSHLKANIYFKSIMIVTDTFICENKSKLFHIHRINYYQRLKFKIVREIYWGTDAVKITVCRVWYASQSVWQGISGACCYVACVFYCYCCMVTALSCLVLVVVLVWHFVCL